MKHLTRGVFFENIFLSVKELNDYKRLQKYSKFLLYNESVIKLEVDL